MKLFKDIEGFLDLRVKDNLDLEQLPQLVKLAGVQINDGNFTLYGPDGTVIRVGSGRPEIKTPLHKRVIPWKFPRIDLDSLQELTNYLLKCEEGESLFNPSPWERDGMKPGEVKAKGDNEENTRGESTLEVDTGMLNPVIHYLNPFIVQEVEGTYFQGETHFVSLSINHSITFVSSVPAKVTFRDGIVKVEGKDILQIITEEWVRAKPLMRLWDLINKKIYLHCKYKFPISLYRIQPSCVIPLDMRFEGGNFSIILENFSNRPVMSTFFVAGRITEAFIADLGGRELERLNVDYDRVNIPMRRWGISYVRMKIKPLPEILLKKKISR